MQKTDLKLEKKVQIILQTNGESIKRTWHFLLSVDARKGTREEFIMASELGVAFQPKVETKRILDGYDTAKVIRK